MGRVFTVEQVAHRQVPDAGSFNTAAQELLETLPNLDHFAGMLVLGSVTTGSANKRSDLDVFVHLAIGPHIPLSRAYAPYWEAFDKVYAGSYVPIEANLFESSRLLEGVHTIDPFFKKNLESVGKNPTDPDTSTREQWIAGTDPVPYIHIAPEVDLTDSYQRYAIAKLDKFTKAPRTFDARAMQRALELPTALGRKSLALLQNSEEVRAYDFVTGSRAVVTRALEKADLPDSCRRVINAQNKLNNVYASVLDETLAGSMSTERYGSWLNDNYRHTIANAIDVTEKLMDHTLYYAD